MLTTRTLGLALLTITGIFLTACGGGGVVGASPVSQTPVYYTENKPFYLEDLCPQQQHTQVGRKLMHLYEFDQDASQAKGLVIHGGSPIGVVISGVRIPEDLPGGTRDLAVILDIATSATAPLQSLVVYYQRDVPPGQMLNFQNLLVYSDPKWDPTIPPYFRLRLIDVRAERNQRVQQTLDGVSNLGASLSGLIPHPAIPIVGVAIEAAKLVLGNQSNQTLLDYQIEFFSAEQVNSAGGADLAVLRAGSWLVLGRPRDTVWPPVANRPYGLPPPNAMTNPSRPGRYEPSFPAEVWREPLAVDRKTGQILRTSDGRVIFAPYVNVVIMQSDAQVPKFILDRSAELIQLLSTPAGKADLDGLDHAVQSLLHSEQTFKAKRRIQNDHSFADLEALMRDLQRNDTEKDPKKKIFGDQEALDLLGFVNQLFVAPDASRQKTIATLLTWWDQTGSNGFLVEDKSAPLGVRWKVTAK